MFGFQNLSDMQTFRCKLYMMGRKARGWNNIYTTIVQIVQYYELNQYLNWLGYIYIYTSLTRVLKGSSIFWVKINNLHLL